MTPSKTAVVLIEYQHDFTTENGVLHAAVKETMDATDMLKNTQGQLGRRDRGGRQTGRRRHHPRRQTGTRRVRQY